MLIQRWATCFLSSKDASKDVHTCEYIFDYIDKCIEDLGAENILHVITYNDTNNVAASRLLKDTRPRTFWTGCAAHTSCWVLLKLWSKQNRS